jgi:hypothetical protein
MNRSLGLTGFALAAQLAFVPGALACEAHAAKAKTTDTLVAEKCSCQGASDCTCKKGECQCKKCGGRHKKATLFESLSEPVKPTTLPEKAELDASAGMFI